MREELFWDRNGNQVPAYIVIEGAINFGGINFIKEVLERYGMETFVHTLKDHRNLSEKAFNYWRLMLGIDRNSTRAFQTERIWEPFR